MSIELPGEEGRIRQVVERRVEAAGKAGVDLASLLADKAVGAERAALERALAELAEAGVVAEWNGRWLAVSRTDWVAGTLQVLERGDALLRSGAGGEPGYFIARRHLAGGRDRDLVLARPRRVRRRRRGSDRLPEAVVFRVLTSRRSTLVGSIDRSAEFPRLLPLDPRLSLEVELPGARDLDEGTFVVVALPERAGPAGGRLLGEVAEVLGSLAEPGVDVVATVRHFEIPDDFPPAALAAAGELPTDPTDADLVGREDLRDHLTVTIDGETARDFDDAISLEDNGDGTTTLGVHIADVSHYVAEGSALDLEAYRRGTSVYFPDRAVPMLPERLSNGLCSLRPEVDRLTLSAFLTLSSSGVVTHRRFAPTVIRSARRLTYAEVRRLLEEPRPEDGAEYGPVLDLLARAQALMRARLARRIERGSIDFDLPEGDVILDLDGVTVGVRPGERSVAHRIIEEFMIAANEAVALELEGHDQPALYRVHEEPDRSRILELKELLEPLGVDLEAGEESLHPAALQAVLRQVEGHREEPFVSTLVLRAMQRARYHPECLGHYALAARHYTHFTSPIRRYPDLVVHRQLREVLAGAAPAAGSETFELRLPTIAEHTSDTEARAERAERLVLQWKVVRFLAGREGETFTGRVTGVKPYGLFIQLTDFFVDGLLPLANLHDDFYEYQAERHELLGRSSGRRLRLADELEVVLEEVDSLRRRLVLGLERPS